MSVPVYAPELPDGAVVNSAVCVISWLDPGCGEMRYSVKTIGDVPLSSQLGLLEIAKLDLWHDANEADA